jgi:hypothetical protein
MKIAILKWPIVACALATAATGCGGGGGGSTPSTPGVQLPVNAMPTVSSMPSQSIDENGYTDFLSFTIGDAETDASQLTVAAASSNSALIPRGGLSLAGTGTDRTLIVTPTADQSGTASVTLMVTDGAGGSASTSFDIAVNPLYRAEFSPWMRAYVATKDAETNPVGEIPESGTLTDVENIARIKFSDATEDDSSAYNDLLPPPEPIPVE